MSIFKISRNFQSLVLKYKMEVKKKKWGGGVLRVDFLNYWPKYWIFTQIFM